MTERNGGKREIYWAVWFIAFGAFFISGALFLEHVLEKVISAMGGVILVSLGLITLRDREVHKWTWDVSVAVASAVSIGLWLL